MNMPGNFLADLIQAGGDMAWPVTTSLANRELGVGRSKSPSHIKPQNGWVSRWQICMAGMADLQMTSLLWATKNAPGIGWSYYRYPHIASSAWLGLALLQKPSEDSPVQSLGIW